MFGFALSRQELHDWAERFAPQVVAKPTPSINIIEKLLPRLPRRVVTIFTTVQHPVIKADVSCIGVGSNENKRLMARCEDEELIREYMEVLGTDERPRWHRITLRGSY